ncbi:TIGR04282 family arsenosugar biosynthesis glycosyltransferase [Salegentibacter sp. F188]|uniref:TIGR04282 family arsenosugar biosynthesis glycosyltransferase n=1 Tax=Autumnicola patrickiae TaxID=3075591 RepID=A0ABU3E6H1_9FLAO|nr:TIGR04282 family arsenosugar biosynthesis glycosyltransferase [Salegentibacter sp. F188]MDT0691517.1 TIGR04282 family arsenosugar biosynthesis glycosyltransferase [Salegentibacter sp. F188]
MQKNLKDNLLLIFTRNPEFGKVKTRLAKDTGDKTALEIYKFLLKHTVSVTKQLKITKRVYYSEESQQNDIWEKAFFEKRIQKGSSLGERMKNAFEEGFQDGYRKIAIIGSDLFDIQQKDLEEAFEELQKNEYVIGPAEDGGYYFLGMKSLNCSLFSEKNWGTDSVLHDTLKDLQDHQVKLLKTRNDVDTLDDIRNNPAFQQFLK